jgi:outer membrane protein W
MKHRAIWLGLVAVFLCTVPSTRAQGKFEISPFAGYETGASYWVNPNFNGTMTGPINSLRVNDATAYGTFLDYNLSENFQLEFMWDRNNTSFSGRQISDGTYVKLYNSDVDQFQFGGQYTFLDSTHRFRPYVATSLGFTHDSNSAGFPNNTEFAFSVGGGVKYYLTRHIGLRGDIRYLPTYGSSTYGYYCGVGYCYNGNNFLNRGNFVGGVIFKF